MKDGHASQEPGCTTRPWRSYTDIARSTPSSRETWRDADIRRLYERPSEEKHDGGGAPMHKDDSDS